MKVMCDHMKTNKQIKIIQLTMNLIPGWDLSNKCTKIIRNKQISETNNIKKKDKN